MRKIVVTVASLLLLVAASDAQARRPRPSDVAAAQTAIAPNGLQLYNDYASPESVYASGRVVVHYVVHGIDAPPLNDDDGDAVPDYVERVAEAADRALAYYEGRGFRAPLPDSSGPDSRPDLYISRFTPGTLGVAFPAADADGGGFVVVANNLDPSAEQSFASLYATVAHEVFHLVQFAYFAHGEEPIVPPWILEGTASGLEGRVYPELDDIVTSLQLRRWFAATQVPITQQSYGAQLLWSYLDRIEPRLLPLLLERLGAHPSPGDRLHLVRSTFARVAGAPFAPAFARFALSLAANHASDVEPFFDLRPGTARRTAIAPLAVQLVRLELPRRGSYLLTVRFPSGRDSASSVLTYELENEIPGQPASSGRISGRWSDDRHTVVFAVPRALRTDPRLSTVRLVLSNGGERRVAYVVSAR